MKLTAPSSAEFKNDWSYVSIPSITVDGVYGDFIYVNEETVGLYRMLVNSCVAY